MEEEENKGKENRKRRSGRRMRGLISGERWREQGVYEGGSVWLRERTI
jgi:hypothetical protein